MSNGLFVPPSVKIWVQPQFALGLVGMFLVGMALFGSVAIALASTLLGGVTTAVVPPKHRWWAPAVAVMSMLWAATWLGVF